jgi:hypothetical protein
LPIKPYQGGAKINLAAIDWHTLPSFDAWVIRLEFLTSEQRDPVQEAINQGILSPNGHPTDSVKRHVQKAKLENKMDTFNWDDDFEFFF